MSGFPEAKLPRELIDRYVDANRTLLEEPFTERDAALLGFVRRHPRSVPYLDAASGLLRPGSPFRSKLLIMAAILETSPHFAEEFLPRHTRAAGLFLHLFALGLAVIVRVGVGSLIYAAAIRPRR